MATRSHYEVLSVPPDANADDVRRAYHKLARDHHPDRFTDPAEKRRAEDMFSAMTDAFNVLSSPERRREYDQKLREESSGESPAQKEAKSYVKAGISKLNQGGEGAADAVRLFKAAVHLDSTEGSYYAHLARAYEATGSFGDASRAWEEAIKRDPYSVKYHRLAGRFLEKAGMKLRARKMFENVLQWEKEDREALEAVKRLSDEKKSGLLSGLFKRS